MLAAKTTFLCACLLLKFDTLVIAAVGTKVVYACPSYSSCAVVPPDVLYIPSTCSWQGPLAAPVRSVCARRMGKCAWQLPIQAQYPLLNCTVHVHAAWEAFVACHVGLSAAVCKGVRNPTHNLFRHPAHNPLASSCSKPLYMKASRLQ